MGRSGASLGFIFGGAVCGSRGPRPLALVESLPGAVFGSLCFGFGGLALSALVVLRRIRFVWALNDNRFPWRYLLTFVIAGGAPQALPGVVLMFLPREHC